jgi:hypothetical protein
MPFYTLSPLFQPQYANGSAATALAFATAGNPTTVPAGYSYQIATLRVSNVTAAPVTLEVWRVPVGSAADNQHLVIPSISIPVAASTQMDIDLTALWGAVLEPGDAIYAEAGAASSLVISGDGAVITL